MSDPVLGLLDRRRRQPSHRTAPAPKFSGSCSSIARGIRTSTSASTSTSRAGITA